MEPLSAIWIEYLDDHKGVYKVFCKPFWNKGNIVEVEMTLLREDFMVLDVPMFETEEKAYEYAAWESLWSKEVI